MKNCWGYGYQTVEILSDRVRDWSVDWSSPLENGLMMGWVFWVCPLVRVWDACARMELYKGPWRR